MHDLFSKFIKTFVAIDPLSLIPLFVVLTSNIDSKNIKIVYISFNNIICTNVFFFSGTFFGVPGNIDLLLPNNWRYFFIIYFLRNGIRKKNKEKKKFFRWNSWWQKFKNIAVFNIHSSYYRAICIDIISLISENFNYTFLISTQFFLWF